MLFTQLSETPGEAPRDSSPAALASAAQDGIADEHLVVAVGERGVVRIVTRAAGQHVGVDGPKVGGVGVEALDESRCDALQIDSEYDLLIGSELMKQKLNAIKV